MAQLPEAIAAGLESEIVMDARVTHIQSSSGGGGGGGGGESVVTHNGRSGVRVLTTNENRTGSTEDGNHNRVYVRCDRQFTSDYLVVTIPFSALRLVDVQPQFSYGKRRAIAEMHYDSATKVLIEFSERFWEWDETEWTKRGLGVYRGHDSIGGGDTTDGLSRFIYFPSKPPRPDSKGGVVLASYTWADEANRWDSMKATTRYEMALDGLCNLYGVGIKRYFTGFAATQSWMNSPYAFGEAAVLSPGQLTKLHLDTHTTEAEGRIFFAGEHTSLKHAWIEGAIESACRAARRIWCTAARTVPSGSQDPSYRSAGVAVAASDFAGSFGSGGSGSGSGTAVYSPLSMIVSGSGGSGGSGGKITVAQYLQYRLQQFNVSHVFGVAGNYTAPFLNTILADPKATLPITGIENELCAGYAADAFARMRVGQGATAAAVAVTYGVGAFSVMNAVAGSFVERVPVIVINGAPTNKEQLNLKVAGLLYSHTAEDALSNVECFRRITISAQRITNAGEAASQIDAALTACFTRSLPVYLEIAEDLWRVQIPAPTNHLNGRCIGRFCCFVHVLIVFVVCVDVRMQ